MKLRIVIVICTLYPSISYAEINTVDFLKLEGNTTKVLKSLNSGLCHPEQSSYRDRVKISDDQSKVYDSLKSCIESGGTIPASIKENLIEEDPVKAEEITRTETNAEIENSNQTKFAGLNWGAGLALMVYDDPYIKDVTIEDSIVRVKHEVKNTAVAMLESHYFFISKSDPRIAYGPYVSIGLVGEDGIDPLSMYGLGWMWGFRRPDQGTSWNIGIGYFIDSETERLISGVNDGDSTTETDPTKLIQKSDEGGWMLMFSANL